MNDTQKNEIWKDIKGYKGLYRVSDWGRIESSHKKRSSIYKRKGTLILRINKLKSGYCYAHLVNNKGQRRAIQVHRLVAIAFVSNPKNKPDINHKDGNKKNNFASNLEWSTKSENTRHSYKIGRVSSVTYAKITKKIVERIRNLYPRYTQRELAKRFNVGQAQVSRIINKVCWKN